MSQEAIGYQPSQFIAISYDSPFPLLMKPMESLTNPAQLDQGTLLILQEDNPFTRSALKLGEGENLLPEKFLLSLSGGYNLAFSFSSTSQDINRFVLTLYPQLDYSMMDEPLFKLVKNLHGDLSAQFQDFILNRLPVCTVISPDQGILLSKMLPRPRGFLEHRIFQFISKDNWYINPHLTNGQEPIPNGKWQGHPKHQFRFSFNDPYYFEYETFKFKVPEGITVGIKAGVKFASDDFTNIDDMIRDQIKGTIVNSELQKAVKFYCG